MLYDIILNLRNNNLTFDDFVSYEEKCISSYGHYHDFPVLKNFKKYVDKSCWHDDLIVSNVEISTKQDLEFSTCISGKDCIRFFKTLWKSRKPFKLSLSRFVEKPEGKKRTKCEEALFLF